jgi:hypothetical protein
LWQAAETTIAERKEIIRQVVERVVVTIKGESERVDVTIQWAGGSQTSGILIRPVARFEQLSYFPQLGDRIRALVADGQSAATIADHLNAEGYRPAKRASRFSREGVQDLIQRLGLHPPATRQPTLPELSADEWWLADLAQSLDMPRATLDSWIRRGWVQARRERVVGRDQWVVRADQMEVERLRQHRRQPPGAVLHDRWVDDGHALDVPSPPASSAHRHGHAPHPPVPSAMIADEGCRNE